MDLNETDNNPKPELTIQALDQGCLQELFSRCTTTDLPVLAQSCKQFKEVLEESELVWARRLKHDFGMHLQIQNTRPGATFSLAKHIYTSSRDETLRFQGALVNGSVDDMNMWYWVDNLFKKNRSYFCSDASNNVDCLGLLLDGKVEREDKYATAHEYMKMRCRYAAALFEHIHHPELANAEHMLMDMVEEWSDQQLENFFLSLAENLQNDENNPIGRLLFYDVPEVRIATEQQRIRAVVAYLLDRLKALKNDLIILKPGGGSGAGGDHEENPHLRQAETLFDSTVLNKLQPEYPTRLSSIIYELHLSRAGSLTCPVRTGVIFVGIINRAQLKGVDAKTAAERLLAATKDPICSAFDGVGSVDALVSAINKSKFPDIVPIHCDEASGVWYEFEPEEGGEEERRNITCTEFEVPKVGSAGSFSKKKNVPLISWRPLVWFKYNSAEEVDVFEEHGSMTDSEDDEDEDEEEEYMDVENTEGLPPSSASIPAAHNNPNLNQHGDHSGAIAGPSTQNGDGDGDGGGEPLEGVLSDADMDAYVQGQPSIYALGEFPPGVEYGVPPANAPAAPIEGNGGGGGGAEGEQEEEEEDDDEFGQDDEEAFPPPPFMIDHTIGRNELHVMLQRPVVADVIMVKLINQENLMDELLDGHAYPNIDMTYVHVVGKKIEMPDGVGIVAKSHSL